MPKDRLIDQLNTYRRRWSGESATVQKFIDFILNDPRCFENDLLHGHVTGSAWVVNRDGTQVLLTHHKRLNKWVQLGGHADGNADVLNVALREAKEESGLDEFELVSDEIFDIDIHLIPARAHVPEHFHYDLRYAFRVTGNHSYVVSEESHDLGWIKIDEIGRFSNEESMLRMAHKWVLQTDCRLR
ncbi:MAG: NUDIX hydrolase [Candidatus Riflebacteria bacterium]|nr:NUDIX hydrolase [Candidatus Riflebacteria bacterium]